MNRAERLYLKESAWTSTGQGSGRKRKAHCMKNQNARRAEKHRRRLERLRKLASNG